MDLLAVLCLCGSMYAWVRFITYLAHAIGELDDAAR